MSGTLTETTSSGVASFSSIYITTAGSFNLQASATYMTTISSTSSYTVIQLALTTLTLSSTATSYTGYFDFSVTVALKDQQSSSLTSSTSVTLSGSNVFSDSTLSCTTTSASCSYTIYCKTSGGFTVTATSGSVTGTLALTCLQNQIKFISITPTVIFIQPTLVTSSFETQLGIYDNAGTTLITKSSFSLVVSLSTTGTITGTLTGSTSAGLLTLTGLTITTYGSYQLKATCSGLTDGLSTSLTIRDLHTVTVTSTTTSYASGYDFSVTVTLLDNLSSSWTQSSSVALTGTNFYSSSSLTTTTTSGSCSFTIYCSSIGSISITATSSSITGALSLTCAANKIVLTLTPTVIFIQPSSVSTSFVVEAKIYDSAGTNLITRGSHSITLALSPSSGTITGTLTGTTSSGVYSFSSLKITSYGVFKIQATGTDLTMGESASLTILDLVTVSVSSTDTSFSVYYDFTVTVNLKDQNSNLWTEASTVTLTGTNLYSSTTLTGSTSSGIINFTVYCTSIGSLTITATSGTKTGTLTVTLAQNMIKVTLVSTVSSK